MQEITEDKWLLIINPKSGKSKSLHQQDYLFDKLKEKNIPFDYRLTGYAGHATELAKAFAQKNYKKFLVVGGDGSMSEVINGIFSAGIENTRDIQVAIIPRGTGNDWARFWGLTKDYKRSVDIFLKGVSRFIDIGKLSYNSEKKTTTHFFINSLGMGLDAHVVDGAHRLKRKLGSHSFNYTLALLRAVFSYHARKMRITADHGSFDMDNMFTMSIANGCYTGGGLKQTPDAVPYDGLFDVMIARKPSFKEILTALTYLFRGKILQHSIITSFQTRKIDIESEHEILMEADGILLHGKAPYNVEILPDAVQMIVPAPNP